MYRGGLGKLYYENAWADGADIPGSPTWNLVPRVVDASFEGDSGSADVSNRDSDWEMTVPGLKNGRISFGFRPKQGSDSIYVLFANGFYNDTLFLFALMDQAIATSGSKGWRSVMRIESFNEEQPNSDSAMVNITLAPAPGFDASGDIIEPARLTTS